MKLTISDLSYGRCKIGLSVEAIEESEARRVMSLLEELLFSSAPEKQIKSTTSQTPVPEQATQTATQVVEALPAIVTLASSVVPTIVEPSPPTDPVSCLGVTPEDLASVKSRRELVRMIMSKGVTKLD